MIEEGLFSHFLKPLLKKKNEKESIAHVLRSYLKTDFDCKIKSLNIKIENISSTQKRELLLNKDQIETDLENTLLKKYRIHF